MDKVKLEERNVILSVVVTSVSSFVLIFIPIWQLVIIAGIAGGLLNRKMLYGSLCGAVGVFITWLIYSLYNIIAINALTLLDRFGGLILGSGFGGLILTIILLCGALFGALGGALGTGVRLIVMPFLQRPADAVSDVKTE